MSQRTKLCLTGLLCFLIGALAAGIPLVHAYQDAKPKAPDWKHGMELRVRRAGESDFNKDTKGNLSKANANWPALVEKKGK